LSGFGNLSTGLYYRTGNKIPVPLQSNPTNLT